MSRFATANPPPRNRRFASTSRFCRGNEGCVAYDFQLSGIEHPANLDVKLYIYISGEDNPVLSTLDSQRLYRLLEDLLFRLTSFSLLQRPPLPRFSFAHRRRLCRCSNYYHRRCPETVTRRTPVFQGNHWKQLSREREREVEG